MTVYVDEIRDYPTGKWSHMWTDGDVEELHAMALSIGMKRIWFQDRRKADGTPDFQHYDLRPSVRTKALDSGAKFMPLAKWIKTRRIPGL